jgi:hypothetical protein
MGRENIRPREPPFMKLITGRENILDQDDGANVKHYKFISSVGLFRMAASAADNCCWFDSFLQCTSPHFRAMKLDQRLDYVHAFRDWCREHQYEIYYYFVDKNPVYSLLINDRDFEEEMAKHDEEIETMAGFVIAWYFGYNLVFLPRDKASRNEIAVFCASCNQTLDKKVILMHFTGNHFEPVGYIEANVAGQLDEAASMFAFDWSDGRLCGLKAFYEKQKASAVCQAAYGSTIPADPSWMEWQLPVCSSVITSTPKTRKKRSLSSSPPKIKRSSTRSKNKKGV